MRRAVQEHVEDPLTEGFLKGDFRPGTVIKIDAKDDKVVLKTKASKAAPKAKVKRSTKSLAKPKVAKKVKSS